MYTSASTLALAGGLFAATGAAAETVHGVLVFSRHGDRTAKHFGNTVLTSLGAQQVFQVGSDYRARYLASDSPHRISNISEFEYVPAQVWASAPDQAILLNTATSFLQGLYPPLGDVKPALATTSLANGSSVSSPLSGYQYVTLHGVDDASAETVWIKGDDNCPAVTAASASFNLSTEYQSRVATTRDFYRSLYPLLSDYYSSADDISYTKAYDIFDLVNVERIHNASSPAHNITDAQLVQLRTLADSAEFGANFNASQPARYIHARTFAGAVLSHLNQSVSGQNPKFTLLAGSYDTFLAFFGLANLTSVSTDFYGLPDYASTMAFELFTPTAGLDVGQLHVRYLFRNGTQGTLTAYPLFGSGKTELPWSKFVDAMRQRGISDVETWCGECQSSAVFCAAYNNNGNGAGSVTAVDADDGGSVSRGSWNAVLVVMVVAIAANLVWAGLWLVKRQKKQAVASKPAVAVAKGSDSFRSYDGMESV
ncbi:histidine phosphatase superfamily [Achaetomium macrosporum]|uniref:Histidine phosphatase superfamily n=1 Tax=Achaetomium macrosporum TaxID=79813 RepID=A0AAN7C299_9PEZI|nr:histidine phosphatase superfamily [Achaetomium macrosporum]